MPRPKKTSSPAERKLSAGALKALWKNIPIQEWYRILQQVNRDGHWSIQGHSLKGCCPYHDDRTPSFVLNFDKCLGKCFGSCGKVVTDLVNLYARLCHKSYAAALADLAIQLDIASIIGPGADELPEFNQQQEMKKAAAMAMSKVIDEYVRDKPSYLSYMRPALIYLTVGRKLPYNILGSLPVGIFAKPEHLKKHIPDEYHKCFDDYFAKVDVAAYGSPCFHYNDQPGSISRFKIRRMCPDAQEACARIAPKGLTEDIARSLGDKSFLVVDDPFIKEMGVFGLHHYNRMLGASETNAYLTEGEFDALSVMAAQLAESRTDFMIFAFGGNGNSGLSFLREFGIRTIWLLQDAPVKKGDDVARRLLLNTENFVGDSANKALSYKIFQWPPEMRGGDIDEAVRLMGYSSLLRWLHGDRGSTFLNTYSWVVGKCDTELESISRNMEAELSHLGNSPEEVTLKENLTATARENTVSTVKNWFRCLHDQVAKLSYVQRYSQKVGLDLSQLNEVNSSLYELNTVEGATARLAQALSEHIEIAYYDKTSSGPQYTIWSRHLNESFVVPMTERAVEIILTHCIGKDVVLWVKALLAGSSILEIKPSGNAVKDLNTLQKTVAILLAQAMKQMIPESRSIQTMTRVGQGIHYRDLDQTESAVYFVNGAKVFRGRFGTAGSNALEWEYLNSTSDKQLYFMLDKQKKWSVVDDESDLYSGMQADPLKLYHDLKIILDGWKFEQHELTRDYLAAWILSLPIQRAINMVNMTFITGASTSGKTSFVRGLLGGNLVRSTFEVPSIIEGSWFTSDATAAGIYQEMNNSGLTLCLDEAEARQNTDHSQRVSEFQQIAYSIPFGGARLTRGGSTEGMRTSYNLCMPVVMAAINMAANPVFLNRVVPVYTERDINRKNIGTYIFENFSMEDIERIRRDVTVCLLDKLPALCRRLPELRSILAKLKTEIKVDDRYVTMLLPALVVYDYLGFSAEDMFRGIVRKNRNLIENLNSQDFHSDLLNAVLYTPGIRTNFEDNNAVLVSAKDLILGGDFVTLNNSACGVKLLQERAWIVIFWRDVKYALLKQSEFRYFDEASLRESVSKNKYLVNNISPDDHSYIVKTLGRTDIKNSAQYSVLSAEYILGDAEITAMKMRGDPAGDVKRRMAERIPIEVYEADASIAEETDFGNFSL